MYKSLYKRPPWNVDLGHPHHWQYENRHLQSSGTNPSEQDECPGLENFESFALMRFDLQINFDTKYEVPRPRSLRIPTQRGRALTNQNKPQLPKQNLRKRNPRKSNLSEVFISLTRFSKVSNTYLYSITFEPICKSIIAIPDKTPNC